MKFERADVYRFFSLSDPLPMFEIQRLGFTGHRDWYAWNHALMALFRNYGGGTWVHGGAETGFDAQIHDTTLLLYISEEVHRPDYGAFPNRPKYAPIYRNRHKIVDTVDCLVGLWDGREQGGTYDTLCYAYDHLVPIILLQPHVKVTK